MSEQATKNTIDLSKHSKIIQDIIRKILELEDPIRNERFLDLILKIDEGFVKFITITGKHMYTNHKKI